MEVEWTPAEDELALGNNRALNAIFNGVTPNVFKQISKCSEAKEAWETLKVTYEGTSQVRMAKLQQLTTKWENAKMKEEEDIATYGATITDMANEAFSLGEPMSNEKQVRKVLRTLPKRFESKVTAIEESKDLTVMKIDDLLGNLATYETKFESEDIKKKGIALKVSHDEDDEGDLNEAISLLAKRFGRTIKKYNKKPADYHSGNDKWSDSWKGRNNNKNGSSGEQSDGQNHGKGIQCRECEGYGHIQVRCPNYIRKQAKTYYATHSDGDSDDDEQEEGKINNFVAFTVQVDQESTVTPTVATPVHVSNDDNDDEDDNEELTLEEVMTNYEQLYNKWTKLVQTSSKVEGERKRLEAENTMLFEAMKDQQSRIETLEDELK